MENEKLQSIIIGKFTSAQAVQGKQYLEISVENSQLLELCKFLKENSETSFNYLFCESAVDFLTHFTMVYHLEATKHRHQIVVKTNITDRVKPEISSVYSVWKGADLHEREIFDLFGIEFTNHPDMRKIFLDNDWVGFPMRKDYVDEVNIVER